MKKQFWFLIMLFALAGNQRVFGQGLNPEWLYTYSYGSTGNVVDGVPDQFGGYYLLGKYLELSCFANQVVLCKVSPSGSQIWAKEYFADTACQSENAYFPNYVGTELYLSGLRQQGWLFKVDSSGTIVWQVNDALTFSELAYHNDDNLSVVAPPGVTVYHYDTTGAFQWNQQLPTLFSPYSYDLLITSDTLINMFCLIQDTAVGEAMGIGLYTLDVNGSLIFDTIVNHGTNTDPDVPVKMCKNGNEDLFLLSMDQTYSSAFVLKINADRNGSTIQSYVPAFNCTPKNIVADTVHNFIYADVRHGSGFHILKFDDQLNILDTIKMDTSSAVETIAMSPNGYLYVAYRPNGIDKNLYLLCYDQTGNCIATYSLLDTTLRLYPNFIQFDSLNNVFVSGDASDGSGGDLGYVLKLGTTVGINEHLAANSQVAIFPNPANDIITIKTEDNNKIYSIRLYNSIGELVLEKKPNSTSTTVQLSSYPSGLYFTEISTSNNIIQTKKILINH